MAQNQERKLKERVLQKKNDMLEKKLARVQFYSLFPKHSTNRRCPNQHRVYPEFTPSQTDRISIRTDLNNVRLSHWQAEASKKMIVLINFTPPSHVTYDSSQPPSLMYHHPHRAGLHILWYLYHMSKISRIYALSIHRQLFHCAFPS